MILGILSSAGAAAAKYYLASSATSGVSRAFGITSDATDNLYITGDAIISGSTYAFSSKYDSSFASSWKRQLATSNVNDALNNIVVDSSGNTYATFQWNSGGLVYGGVLKYNSSGTLQWQRKMTPVSQQIWYQSLALDSANNVIVAGYHSDAGNTNGLVVKYNSSGTLQWQKDITITYGSSLAGIAVDSSDNIIVTGYQASAVYNYGNVIKLDSSGNKSWHRVLGATSSVLGDAVATSGTDIYAVGRGYFTNFDAYLVKYNSSGTLQWQRTLAGASSGEYYGVSTDSSGNVYTVGYNSTAALIVKYNSSGTIQWQRSITISAKTVRNFSVKVTNSGVFFSGYKNNARNDVFFGKIPTDGTKTGTYTLDGQSLVYAASSYTDAAGGLADSAGTSTVATTTKTDAASTLTESAMTSTDASVQL
jgi:hypothetical protein